MINGYIMTRVDLIYNLNIYDIGYIDFILLLIRWFIILLFNLCAFGEMCFQSKLQQCVIGNSPPEMYLVTFMYVPVVMVQN